MMIKIFSLTKKVKMTQTKIHKWKATSDYL